jgi:hypothetical protein
MHIGRLAFPETLEQQCLRMVAFDTPDVSTADRCAISFHDILLNAFPGSLEMLPKVQRTLATDDFVA